MRVATTLVAAMLSIAEATGLISRPIGWPASISAFAISTTGTLNPALN